MSNHSKQHAYQLLIKELIQEFIPSYSSKGVKIKEPALKSLKASLIKTTGVNFTITTKTIRSYIASETYSNQSMIGIFAAAWLINAKKITQEECIKHYYDNPDITSIYYYNEFVRVISTDDKSVEPAEVVEEENFITTTTTQKTPLDSICFTPVLNPLVERNSLLGQLEKAVTKNKLLVIDGVLGSGKTNLLFSLTNKLINSKNYNAVLWKPVEKNLTLQAFVAEIESVIQLGEGSTLTKALKFSNLLKENKWLLILDDFDEVDELSFSQFLKILSSSQGNAEIIIIRNSKNIFDFLRSGICFHVSGFSEEEVQHTLTTKGIILEHNQFKSLFEITDGLPFYIDIFLNQHNFNKEHNTSIKDLFLKSSDSQQWIKFLCSKLSDEELKLLTVLSFYNRPFADDAIQKISAFINLKSFDITKSNLQKNHLLSRLNPNLWRIIPIVSAYIMEHASSSERILSNVLIGDFLLSEINIKAPENISVDDALKICSAIQHYQKGCDFEKSYTILQQSIPLLKRYNLYTALKKVIKAEIEGNLKYDHWLVYHYSQACINTGDFKEFHSSIKIAVQKSFKLYNQDKTNSSYKSFFIKTFQLYSIFVGNILSFNKAKILLTETLSLFDPLELDWSIRSHSLSLLSHFLIKDDDLQTATSITQTLISEDYDNNSQSKAVFNHLLGMIKLKENDVYNALQYFEKSFILFSEYKDIRGLSWSLSFKALTRHMIDSTSVIYEDIKSVIELKQESNNVDSDYLDWLKYFKANLTDPVFKKMITKEYIRVYEIFKESHTYFKEKQIQIEVDQYHTKLHSHIQKPIPIENYITPILQRAIPIDSQLRKSLLQKVRRNPISILQRIFSKKPRDIFSSQNNNNIILECMRSQSYKEEVLSKFILPNIQYIEQQDCDTKIEYARGLQYAGQYSHSIMLLNLVHEENKNFKYYNALGNFYKSEKNFRLSIENFKLASELAKNNKEKAIISYNIASLIYDFNHRNKYMYAIRLCKNAIQLRNNDHYFLKYPINTLLLLIIESTPQKNIVRRVENFKKNYMLTDNRLDFIIRNIKSTFKRQILQRYFENKKSIKKSF